ncbi:arsenate reductase (glutaredoxin) [Bdellovibrio sp. HCB337]|uniref:arsenate reductase (glutaredoxin) n=1 Tax=Bdellovibrio sp. HCB337 TaxID=3394358 RepID=UPI0039A73711
MSNWKIYHNPQCSKSREALGLLQARGIQPKVIEYLKQPPTADELRGLIKTLGVPSSAVVRTKEELFQQLNFDVNSLETVIENLAKHPRLLERPIIVKDQTAVIGRPVENIEKLF